MKAYQLKVQIKNSHPPIWRRVIVPSGITFSVFIRNIECDYGMDWVSFTQF